MTSRVLAVLRPGDVIRVDGRVHTVVGLDGVSVRLAAGTDGGGTVSTVLIGHLLADPSFAPLSTPRVPLPPLGLLERLPAETRTSARWWEQHLVEVITGLGPDAPPGTPPRPHYDPDRCSLRQRELAKHRELNEAGTTIPLSTLQRMRRRYELHGVAGLVDQRWVPPGRGGPPTGRVDPRVVDATRRAISEETNRATGTVGRLRRRVIQILAEEPDPPALPSQRTFYRLVARLASGKHTFDSARTRRSLAKQPEGPFGTLSAARPGEWMQIDSTPLDVRVVLDDGLIDRVELTGLVDQATRSVGAAVLRPTTKAVDAALLLARALTPEPMRPGWVEALRLTRSVLPHTSLVAIDARLAHAAARPVLVPETIVCDHGKAYLSANFRSACRALGINLQPAHPDTPTDKPIVERTLSTVGTLFAQYVAGYVGSSVERRGLHGERAAVWSMAELQALLDEWIVAVWQNRPHDGLRDPLTPDTALTPNERYAAAIAHAGYVPVALAPTHYIELMPTTWRTINSYGIKINRRTYDAAELNPLRRQHSGVADQRGRWQVHHDPYDISRVWVRNHHGQGFIQASWTHLRTAPVPFGEATWAHARQLLAARGQDPVTEADIAAAAAKLLDTAEAGPQTGDQRPAVSRSRRSSKTRRIVGRDRASAPATWPRPAPETPVSEPPEPSAVEDPGLVVQDPNHVSQPAAAGSDKPASVHRPEPMPEPDTDGAQVVALPLFDARKEAQKWW